jgi:hypothetical protein
MNTEASATAAKKIAKLAQSTPQKRKRKEEPARGEKKAKK